MPVLRYVNTQRFIKYDGSNGADVLAVMGTITYEWLTPSLYTPHITSTSGGVLVVDCTTPFENPHYEINTGDYVLDNTNGHASYNSIYPGAYFEGTFVPVSEIENTP